MDATSRTPTPQQMTPALIHHLVDTTAAIFGITPDQVRSSSRERPCVIARNIVADIAYNEYLFTFMAIGKELNRHYSTIIINLESFHNLPMVVPTDTLAIFHPALLLHDQLLYLTVGRVSPRPGNRSTRDWKDTPGMAKESTDKDGSHRNRTDQLARAVYAYGQAAPANRSSGGSRQELWPTPDATNANDGVPWEKFHASMMERRAQVKKAVAEGKTKQGSGRSPNLAASVQNPQWATPSTGKLNPRWVETLMGLPVGWTMVSCSHPIVFKASAATTLSAGNVEVTTRTVHAQDQTAVMTDNRTDELRMLGNGVVPATAARAFVTLMEELL